MSDQLASGGAGSEETPERGRSWAGVVSLVISAMLLFALYRRLDVQAVGSVLRSADAVWLVAALGMIVPITLLIAWRFYVAAPSGSVPGYVEATRLTLVAAALNTFLPSKSGDLVKSYFVATRGGAPARVSVALVVYERLCDFLGLTTWCLIGMALSRSSPWPMPVAGWIAVGSVWLICLAMVASASTSRVILGPLDRALSMVRLDRLRALTGAWTELHAALENRRMKLIAMSVLLWLGHLGQMWMFTMALSAPVPLVDGLARFALAFVAAQMPLTFAGFGARDVALVVLLADYMSPEAAAALGILAAIRGITPGLLALPILKPYVSTVLKDARRWRRG